MTTSKQINSTEFPRGRRIDRIEWLKKEITDNPNHPTNVYLEKELNRLERNTNTDTRYLPDGRQGRELADE